MTLNEFQKPSLTDVAYRELRNSILSGKLPPGRKLVVNDLVEAWRISNTPIKEALNRLVAEGIVESEPRRGMRVRQRLSVKELRDMFEVRVLYETHCCRVAAGGEGGGRNALLHELGEILDQTHAILSDVSSHLILYELDERFHAAIVSRCGNEEIIRNFNHIHSSIVTFGIYSSQRSPLYRQQETYEEHRRVLDALAEHSPDAAAEAMRRHLECAIKGMLDVTQGEVGVEVEGGITV